MDFINKNKKAIIAVAIVAVVAAAGIGGYFGIIKPKMDEEKAVIAQQEADEKARKEQEAADQAAKKAAEEKAESEARAKKNEEEIAKIKERKAKEAEEAKKAESEAAAKKAEEIKNAASNPTTSAPASKKDLGTSSTPSGGNSGTPSKPDAVPSKPAPTPSKPEPTPALKEEDRTPATTQQNQVIDTSLVSSNGLFHHGDYELNSAGQPVYYHVGVDAFIPERDWIQGRWASHPEGTMDLYDKWSSIGYAFSPFQEHGDIIMDGGREFYFCSFCGLCLDWTKRGTVSLENGYKGHTVFPEHIDGVKNNTRYPIIQ